MTETKPEPETKQRLLIQFKPDHPAFKRMSLTGTEDRGNLEALRMIMGVFASIYSLNVELVRESVDADLITIEMQEDDSIIISSHLSVMELQEEHAFAMQERAQEGTSQ